MKETFELSKTFNVSFSKDPVETWLEKIEKMPYEMTSSMYLDFKNSKKLELDWLSGYIVNLGKSKKINFPTHNEIVEGIKLSNLLIFKKLSASNALIQPIPAAVTACL